MEESPVQVVSTSSPARKKPSTRQLELQYAEAYASVRSVAGVSQLVAVAAVLVALGTLVGVLALAGGLGLGFAGYVIAGVAAIISGVSLYAFSVLIDAVAGILDAVLDTAVHTSPLMDDRAKARIMIGE